MRLGIGALVCGIGLAAAAAQAAVPYETRFDGVPTAALADDLKAASELVGLAASPPASLTALKLRADADARRLKRVVDAAGYWESAIVAEVNAPAGEAGTAIVTLRVAPGPQYRLDRVEIRAPGGGAAAPPVPAPEALGLAPGGPALSAPVLAAEPRLVRAYQQQGYPYVRIADRRVVVDRGPHTMAVTFDLDAGPRALFGATTIAGLDRLARDYVDRRVEWRAGAPFDVGLLDRTRDALVDSGLFATVKVAPAEALDADGRVPIRIDLAERPARSVGGSLQYDTGLGFAATGFWEHRNLLGGAERLRTELQVGESNKSLSAEIRRPDLLRRGQDLVGLASFADETVDAYTSIRAKLFGGLERRVAPAWSAGLGAQAERANVTQAFQPRQRYGLAGVPGILRYDGSDDLLNPTRGERASLELTPYVGLPGTDLDFAQAKLRASAYRSFGGARRWVAAGYAALGATAGVGFDALPRDKRLYAGGGGSVRGYAFQHAGPLDVHNNPVGGRSSVELGTELRIPVTDSIGLVPFVEAGTVFRGPAPDFQGRLLVGTGLGLRYQTVVGPVRLDLGVPLERRRSDAPVQVYVSIGQAF